jgi:hypothetical protein
MANGEIAGETTMSEEEALMRFVFECTLTWPDFFNVAEKVRKYGSFGAIPTDIAEAPEITAAVFALYAGMSAGLRDEKRGMVLRLAFHKLFVDLCHDANLDLETFCEMVSGEGLVVASAKSE